LLEADTDDLCYIGFLDLVTITNGYGKTFGTSPE